ncbi:glycosyltransferase [Ramlibacter sp. PS3R-8]|uniref:glycosyltransferase family 2 protein n=1 Tax=Ramlibacter sp. PS3R-8 TaxID=3133437 RepID=UPI0030A186A4
MPETPVPRVAVLVAVYNGLPYVQEAIQSILDQTFRDFELIVVDDASTDETPSALERFRRLDPRVRVLRMAANGGPVLAANHGLAEVRAPLVARLDADDVCRPDRLALQVAAFDRQPELVLLGSAFDYIDATGRVVGEGHPPLEDAALQATLMDSGNPFCHPSVLMRTEALRSLGGYRQVLNPYGLDYDLCLRMAELGKVGNLPQRLIGYRIHPGQITVTKMQPQLRSAQLYRALARQRRSGRPEDLPLAHADPAESPARLRAALAAGSVFWADMLERVGAPDRARQLRWEAVRASPWHPQVRAMAWVGFKRTLGWGRTA